MIAAYNQHTFSRGNGRLGSRRLCFRISWIFCELLLKRHRCLLRWVRRPRHPCLRRLAFRQGQLHLLLVSSWRTRTETAVWFTTLPSHGTRSLGCLARREESEISTWFTRISIWVVLKRPLTRALSLTLTPHSLVPTERKSATIWLF